MSSQNVGVKISERLEIPNTLLVNKVELSVAVVAPEERILCDPLVVHGDPVGDGGLADHAVSPRLIAHASDERILRD